MRVYRKYAGLKNVFLLLVVLSFGFVFISCGNGPMSKVGEPEITVEAIDNGDFSLNFNVTPPDTGDAAQGEVSYVALGRSIDSMAGKEFTFEAWVNTTRDPNVNSTIFARGGDKEGFAFYIANNRPYFILKFLDRPTSANPAYIVYGQGAGNLLVKNTWKHIAVVFTTQDHTLVHGQCDGIGLGARSEASHLDMYINGVWQNCGHTGGRPFEELRCQYSDENPTQCALDYSEFIGRNLTYGFNYYCSDYSGAQNCPTNVPNTHTPGQIIIDDLRIWETARSAADILACYDSELGDNPLVCGRENPDLLSYWKLDDEDITIPGPSTIVTDSALDQNNGILEYCDHNCDVGSATSIIWDCDALAISNPGVLCNNPWRDNSTTTTWQ